MRSSTYQVIELRTGRTIGTYATARAARKVAERKDLAYGAYGYAVVEVSA